MKKGIDNLLFYDLMFNNFIEVLENNYVVYIFKWLWREILNNDVFI